jgi:hypothetical protein
MPHPMIRQIVNRCHVSDSNRTVIRYIISRLRDGYTTFRAMPRRQRRLLMRDAIAVHKANRALYTRVMRGNQRTTRKRKGRVAHPEQKI